MSATSNEPWTIERISEALGSPSMRQRFLSELNKAPAHELLNVFAKWQGSAERSLRSLERSREARAEQLAGRPVPGDWKDATDEVLAKAEQLRSKGAA